MTHVTANPKRAATQVREAFGTGEARDIGRAPARRVARQGHAAGCRAKNDLSPRSALNFVAFRLRPRNSRSRPARPELIDLADTFARLKATNFRYQPKLLDAVLAEHGKRQ
jgi:NAD(P)-dependent dehydrogenase (short-subunit alcohol dehydrogenase family)